MVPTKIEKEILIEAPLEVVWRLLTEPAQLKQWLSDDASMDLKEGGHGRIATRAGNAYDISIETVDPFRRFSFRWLFPAGTKPNSRNSTLVEFTLSSGADGTHLRVVESGFDQIDWSDAERAEQVASHAHGWQECFERLEALAARYAGSEVGDESHGRS